MTNPARDLYIEREIISEGQDPELGHPETLDEAKYDWHKSE